MEQPNAKDLEAHLQVIKGNIKVANKELEEALIKKGEAETSFSSAAEEKGKAQEDLRKALLDVEAAKVSLNNLIKDFERMSLELDKQYGEKVTSLKEEVVNLEAKIAKLKKDQKDEKEETDRINKEISSLAKQVSPLKESIKEYESKEKKARADANKAGEAAEAEQIKLDKLSASVVEKQKELANIQAQIAENQRNIEVPIDSLKKKEEVFEEKVRDFKILINRAQKIWDERFPGQSLAKMIRLQELD